MPRSMRCAYTIAHSPHELTAGCACVPWLQVEGLADLLNADTEAQRRQALKQVTLRHITAAVALRMPSHPVTA